MYQRNKGAVAAPLAERYDSADLFIGRGRDRRLESVKNFIDFGFGDHQRREKSNCGPTLSATLNYEFLIETRALCPRQLRR